jgi:hypothetical protein
MKRTLIACAGVSLAVLVFAPVRAQQNPLPNPLPNPVWSAKTTPVLRNKSLRPRINELPTNA